jgi:hypothetical protein
MGYLVTLAAGDRRLAEATGELDAVGNGVANLTSKNIPASKVTNIGLTLTDAKPGAFASSVA